MLGNLLLPEIEELIRDRQFTELREALVGLPVADIAEIFADLPPDLLAVSFRILPRDQAADVFEYLPLELQEVVLMAMGSEEVAGILNAMAPDDRTALLEEVPGEFAQRLITLLAPEKRRIAVSLLGYPEESIGRLMTPDYVVLKRDWPISRVFDHLRSVGKNMETLNVLYVTDEKGRLVDDILLRSIVVADPTGHVSDLMDEHFVALPATDDQEEAVRTFKKYDRSALPVVDSQGTLVGIVTVDDVLDVAEQEETEDVQKMAAVQALEEPYLEVSALNMVRKRAPWLVLLFGGEMLTIMAMGNFMKTLEKVVLLALFIPLIISSGGNSGSQAASLVIRALALNELSLGDWWRVMRRELLSGLMFGSLLGMLAFAAAFLTGHYQQSTDKVLVAFVVGTSLVGVVLWGTLTGSMLPIVLKRLGFDPAVSSTPFVATLVDVSGILIYFATAVVILRGILS